MKRRSFVALASGVASSWTGGLPLAALGQGRVPVIGFLHSGTEQQNANRLAGFRKGLADGGFVEGQNLLIEYRWAEGQSERLPALAADLVRRQVAVIVAVSSQPATTAAKAATTSIPLVFTWPGDPVESGLVASLARPGGNATGVSTLNKELGVKRLGLLREILPKVAKVSVLVNPTDPIADERLKEFRTAADTLGLELEVLRASNDREIETAFVKMASTPGSALLVNADPFLFIRRVLITGLAARHRVPAIYYDREFATAGGLLSYGTDLPNAWAQAGGYVARILKGEKPGDLPVVQPTIFELVVNLRAARALGLTVPPKLLFAADEVIE